MYCLPLFNTVCTVLYAFKVRAAENCVCLRKQLCRCFSDRLKNVDYLRSKNPQNKSSKFTKMEKRASFLTLLTT